MLLSDPALLSPALHLFKLLDHLSCLLRILPAFGDILTAVFIITASIYFQSVYLLYKQSYNCKAAQLWGSRFTVKSAPTLTRFYSWVLWGHQVSIARVHRLFANMPHLGPNDLLPLYTSSQYHLFPVNWTVTWGEGNHHRFLQALS